MITKTFFNSMLSITYGLKQQQNTKTFKLYQK